MRYLYTRKALYKHGLSEFGYIDPNWPCTITTKDNKLLYFYPDKESMEMAGWHKANLRVDK